MRSSAARLAQFDPAHSLARPAAEFRWAAPRAAYGALGTDRGVHLPPFTDSLMRFVRDFDPAP